MDLWSDGRERKSKGRKYAIDKSSYKLPAPADLDAVAINVAQRQTVQTSPPMVPASRFRDKRATDSGSAALVSP